MKISDQIKECKSKIVELEFNLAVERAVLARLNSINNNNQPTIFDEPRPIIPDSIVPHIQKVLKEKGRPMKVKDILKTIKNQGIKIEGKTEPKRLVSSALVRRKDLFERKDRGLYKLKETNKVIE